MPPFDNIIIQEYYTKINKQCLDNPELQEFLAKTRNIMGNQRMHAAMHAQPICRVTWSRR